MEQNDIWFDQNLILQIQQKRQLFKQLHPIFKKLVLVIAVSTPVTKANKEDVVTLDQIFSIYYLI